MPDKPRDADRAAARLEAAIQRHAGWQLEYDFAIVINDRKRLLARIAELEASDARARSFVALLARYGDCYIGSDGWCSVHEMRPCPHTDAEAFLLGK